MSLFDRLPRNPQAEVFKFFNGADLLTIYANSMPAMPSTDFIIRSCLWNTFYHLSVPIFRNFSDSDVTRRNSRLWRLRHESKKYVNLLDIFRWAVAFVASENNCLKLLL
uniref:Uncharacterized protein n=1 Tax=Echinococcus granulosus TaxID=6210 RepID=A0A068WIA2_ECHGR|nr:hypothetical protein EgrG_000513300 [Echinococcus granulosus]